MLYNLNDIAKGTVPLDIPVDPNPVIASVDAWNGVGPLPTLYTKTAKDGLNEWTVWVEDAYVCTRWGQVGGQMQTTRFECEAKNVGRANQTTPWIQAIQEAASLWKKKVKKKYHWDPNHWEENRNLKPMLAKDYKAQKKPPLYPADGQPKLDGLRCLAYRKNGKVVLQSRGGDPYVVHHIIEQLETRLPDGIILDGELYEHGVSLQTINSWVRRPQEDSRHLKYVVYDMFIERNQESPWDERLAYLQQTFETDLVGASDVQLISTTALNGPQDLMDLHNYYVDQGFEGAMYRSRSGVYRFGYRSSDLLKYKDFQDDEFLIAGWTSGKGKFEDVPIFRCQCGDKYFDVTPKGTQAERLEMLRNAESYVGKMLTVRFFNYTPDGLPFLPVGVAIREPGS